MQDSEKESLSVESQYCLFMFVNHTLPSSISSSEHDVSVDCAWDIDVDLHVLSGAFGLQLIETLN
jgi:hypothetical protein